jgi:hypothetical protein
MHNKQAFVIQKFWKKYCLNSQKLNNIHNILSRDLNATNLQHLSNKCHSIARKCKGDGAGLTGGSLIDMLICEFFVKHVELYKEMHIGECDFMIDGVPLSLKKINGKSSVALDWSKNETTRVNYFSCNMIILNLTTEKWWKTEPTKKIPTKIKTSYSDTIPAGFYIVNKNFCKSYVKLNKNNKTNSLIENQYLYLMLQNSLRTKRFIALPPPNQELVFTISNAFSNYVPQ